MPVLPFHRYVGPGNRIDSGEPVDEDDEIAKVHDIKYENARFQEEIRMADVEAIREFRKSWREGNWHSVIGDLGLSLKYVVETYTGVLYPKLPVKPKCRQIYIQNVFKLRCCFKDRLSDNYTFVVWRTHPKITREIDFERNWFDGVFPSFIYVPIEWSDVYKRANSKCRCKKRRSTVPKIKKSNFTNDIFNLNLWVRLFTKLSYPNKHVTSNNTDDIEVFHVGFLN